MFWQSLGCALLLSFETPTLPVLLKLYDWFQVHMRQPPQQLFHPPPPQMQQPHPHPAQTQAVPMPPSLPLELLARIAQEAQEEAGDGKDDSPVHIIAREEIFPFFHPANPEGEFSIHLTNDT